ALVRVRMSGGFVMNLVGMTNLSMVCLLQLTRLGYVCSRLIQIWSRIEKGEKTAVPCRPCRQLPAPGGAQGSERQARKGRHQRRRAQGGRGPRDREGRQ